jgi:S1/P1 Nuclease
MYIIHFIGDIHQPLHDEAIARGGNEIAVCFDKRCGKENLHGIWDTDIIHKICGLKHTEKHNEEKAAAAKWATKLHSTRPAQEMDIAKECVDIQDPEKCPVQWAKEANAYICSYVMEPGQDWLENNDLGGKYYNGAVKIVESQISKAGVRLAAWINALAEAVSGASLKDGKESFRVEL